MCLCSMIYFAEGNHATPQLCNVRSQIKCFPLDSKNKKKKCTWATAHTGAAAISITLVARFATLCSIVARFDTLCSIGGRLVLQK